ncbi:MAG: hypothetical protein M3020_12770 [Myxococcota bacterium]|jgi:hypothetical protein|nr:hypothetical protein [Myxococcota bacterium]
MKLRRIVDRWPVHRFVQAACWLSLAGLACMVISIVFPAPIPVISAMSVGHAIGLLALLCYLVAVVVSQRNTDASRSAEVSASASARSRIESDRT